MSVDVKDLHRNHVFVHAARAMLEAHARYDTLLPALEEVEDDFPEMTREQLICIWFGINIKAREMSE
jgi:hypothetical protein